MGTRRQLIGVSSLLYYVGPVDHTWVVMLDSQSLCLVSHSTSPGFYCGLNWQGSQKAQAQICSQDVSVAGELTVLLDGRGKVPFAWVEEGRISVYAGWTVTILFFLNSFMFLWERSCHVPCRSSGACVMSRSCMSWLLPSTSVFKTMHTC